MAPNPYESPVAENKPTYPKREPPSFDFWPGEQWPFYLLLLLIAVTGVLIPVIATMNRP